MAKIKRQSVSEVASKAKTARAYATGGSAKKYGWSEDVLQETAMNLSRGRAKGAEKIFGRYATPEEKKAARLMQTQRAAELTRSETRAKSVTKRAAKKASEMKVKKALTGSTKKANKK